MATYYILRMGMFGRLGLGLRVVREWRGKSVTDLAREAGIGKSQLSKYENGRELPKLDSLEKILRRLSIGAADFFSIVEIIERYLTRLEPDAEEEAHASRSLMSDATARAFERMSASTLDLHRSVVEEGVRRALSRTTRRADHDD
jgi:transcriptional regulator with XRE-family HTH domain